MPVELKALDIRIPKWDMENLIERTCPICGEISEKREFIRPDGLSVYLCDKCRTYYISPAPSSDQLTSFYLSYDLNHRREKNFSIKELKTSYKFINPYDDLRIQELSTYMNFKNRKILDVGFGKGYFLYCFKKLGAITYGIEIDSTAISYAKALGIKHIYEGQINNYSFNTKFNLIIMSDLVEHPLKPKELIEKCVSLLDQDGFILIWTPNGRIANNDSTQLKFRVDLEHMQYLSPESINYIASELELKIVHFETLGYRSLDGINRPFNKKKNTSDLLKLFIKKIPGAYFLNKLRNKYITNSFFDRKGSYHLFCILQKE